MVAANRARCGLLVVSATLIASGCGGASDSESTYALVDPDVYQTYRDYSGYRRADIPSAQFTTSSGVRCRIGPNSGDYPAGTHCWGALPGVAPTINIAVVSAFAHDNDTQAMITTTQVPDGRKTYAFFYHSDDVGQLETYQDRALRRHPVDPASYRLLAAGQKIIVKDPFRPSASSVCAIGTDDTITCEIRPADDGRVHGFRLSPSGSRTY